MPPGTGTVVVHLDWPWVYHPEEIRNLAECEAVIKTMAGTPWMGNPTAAVLTPACLRLRQLPERIRSIIESLERKAGLQIVAADDLEDVGEHIAKSRPEIRNWMVGGFWKDLCCADIKHGLKQASRAMIPHNWSAFSELKNHTP